MSEFSTLVGNFSYLNEYYVIPFVVQFFTSALGILFIAVFCLCILLKLFLQFFKIKY